MALINIPKRSTKEKDLALAKKSNSVQKAIPTVKGGGSIINKIQTIQALVETKLGKYKDEYIIIRDEATLIDYIDVCIENGIISLDTETTGLDPLLDDIVGICIYTPGEKGAYIPINHVSYITLERVANQLDIDFLNEQFTRLFDCELISVMFNSKFDIRFMRNKVGVKNIYCTWDSYLAQRCLNENEPHNGLKLLHEKYVLNGEGDAWSFGDLFKNIPFSYIPIKTAYLYAARDPVITYELYDYQRKYLKEDTDREDLRNVYWIFKNIEMPCVSVVADMEDTGIEFDFDYNEKLKEKYHKLLEERIQSFNEMCSMYSKEIQEYRDTIGSSCKLDDPINIKSPTQLAILLYDIMGCEIPKDKKTKKEVRSTNEETLKSMDNPIAKAILDYREFSTIVDTFIDKLPECVNPNDGRIHCQFNQYGARTGRFSSENPNMQNIPSHNKEIRQMFKATDGYVLMSADYSQQEPKVMTMMCQDPKMIKAYQDGKDLYAEIASLSFNTTYENCLEFRPDGTTNKDGKERRSQAKSILLGVLYGRGVPSIAEQLGTTTKKAQTIKDSVMKGFPAIEKFEQDSLKMAEELGYVTTLWGRKRRLPDLQLDEFEFKWKDGAPQDNDVLDFDEEIDYNVPIETQKKYLRLLSQARFGEKRKIFEKANAEGIWIIDNGAKIADAQRQCVNARIQGSAADMSKLAMIKIGNDKILKELGFRMLVPVHDEIIAECPKEHAKTCVDRFSQLMSEAPGEKFIIPIKCDVDVTECWYGDKVEI